VKIPRTTVIVCDIKSTVTAKNQVTAITRVNP
ncbi:uncharacterized protein METZ01_LOCUS236296, partial [marine metagenome]